MKLAIGLITYRAAKYLPYFLPSLEAQTFNDFKVFILDNSEREENENKKYFQKNKINLEIDFEWAGENIGFARGFNKLIGKAKKYSPKYFMMMNFDMILEPDMLEKMIKTMDDDDRLGSASPKIRVWDFENNKKTNIIDSCGIAVKSGLRFVDIGQGQIDENQFDEVKILGPSGTAPIYRMDALKKIKRNGEYFDELMFMYKEDCDMAYRLFLAGYASKLASDAVCYHDRTVKGDGEGDLRIAMNRKNKSRQVKKWSFLNQQIMFVKYWRLQSFVGKLAIIWYQIKILFFILLFEQFLFLELIPLFKIRKKIRKY